MKTTKQLSENYTKLQGECMEKIKSFFTGKSYVRILIMPSQNLVIQTGLSSATVTGIHSNGDIFFSINNRATPNIVNRVVDNEPLPVDALLTILDELERMKKGNQLMKP